MPTAFLMQQMQWREALEEASHPPTWLRWTRQVARDEGRHAGRSDRPLLDERNDAAAADQVRALMFVARFRQDIERRLDTLDAHR
jgi:molecular chaperone HscB